MTPEDREARRKQYNGVWRVMVDGQWRSLEEIQLEMQIVHRVYAPLQSISARLRDFRKKKHGAHTVHRFEYEHKPRIFKYKLEKNSDAHR